jgi:hypothetical protein
MTDHDALQPAARDAARSWGGHLVAILLSCRECLLRSPVDAVAGRPGVTTDVASRREVVCDGMEGILVPRR